jgi:hypothetical protein
MKSKRLAIVTDAVVAHHVTPIRISLPAGLRTADVVKATMLVARSAFDEFVHEDTSEIDEKLKDMGVRWEVL